MSEPAVTIAEHVEPSNDGVDALARLLLAMAGTKENDKEETGCSNEAK